MQIFRILFLLGLSAITVGCTSSVPMESRQDLVGYEEDGIASYYAMKYQFRQTASGERFNQFSKTAAHRQLPFGTKVKVTNMESGKSVVVKINDRGPFVSGRVIDLSRSAFSSISDLDRGVVDVRIQVVN